MTTTVATMTTTVAAMTTEAVGPVRRALASIRMRIVVGYLVLLTVALLVAIVVTRQLQLARADREIEREQAQEVEELQLLAGEGVDPATGDPFGDDVHRIFDVFLRRNVPSDDEAFYTVVDGQVWEYSFGSPALFEDPQFLPAWTVEEPTVSTATSDVADVGEVRSLAVPIVVDGSVAGVFVVASFPDVAHGEVADVVRLITIAGLGVLGVTTALAWSLAGRVLRPVRELTSTAKQINQSDLSARIPVEGHDELAELGTTFNDMVDRLEQGFTSQRQFLDDVAHELRTPITIARGHLEVLGDDPTERAETVEIVTDELDRMSRYVTDLLVLAKSDQPDFLVTERIDLGELAVDLLARVSGLGARDVGARRRAAGRAGRDRGRPGTARPGGHQPGCQRCRAHCRGRRDRHRSRRRRGSCPAVGPRHRTRHRSGDRSHPVRPPRSQRDQPHAATRRHGYRTVDRRRHRPHPRRDRCRG